jgi:hypothetical protein
MLNLEDKITIKDAKSQFLNKNTQFDITTIRKQYYTNYIKES